MVVDPSMVLGILIDVDAKSNGKVDDPFQLVKLTFTCVVKMSSCDVDTTVITAGKGCRHFTLESQVYAISTVWRRNIQE